ncbi:MAG: amidohydrolase family protein [Deltaproteobacteria bacterium]|nr:amidohydrolase family protein [Deltaproteobacteria bacterium]
MLIRARFLKNPQKDLIKDPIIWIKEGKIQEIAFKEKLSSQAKADPKQIDFPGILYPGLINAHAHLELSHLQALTYPGSFCRWIEKILVAKSKFPSSQKVFEKGFALSLKGGTTTIGEHFSLDSPPEAWLHSPLRARIFGEVLGLKQELANLLYQVALSLKPVFKQNPKIFFTPSPHSVHALEAETLFKILKEENNLLSLHLAESQAEDQYFKEKTGEMADFIELRGSALKRQASSAIQELKQRWRGNLLVVHGNYLDQEDFDLIQSHGNVIVHCPLSHAYFAHQAFPLKETQKRKIPVALGTDSLSSASSLSMLEVMRSMKTNFAFLSLEEIFTMATLHGAKGLDLSGQVGEVICGGYADLIALKTEESLNQKTALEKLFKAKQVDWVMVNGEIQNHYLNQDEL